MRKKLYCANYQWHDSQGNQGELPIHLHHDDERSNQCDHRSKDVGETLVVDCLNRLRVVRDAKTGITRAPCIVVFQRERLQICVKLGAQFEQRLQPDFHEEIVRDPIDDSPRKLDYDESETKDGNPRAPVAAHGPRGSQKIVHDDLERPRFQQVQGNS